MSNPPPAPPGRVDALGLRRGPDDRILPLLVAAMAFLAALTLAGSDGIGAFVRHWQQGAESAVTVQVPTPGAAGEGVAGANRLDSVLARLRAAPEVSEATPLSAAELTALLRPWLGDDPGALPLPAVVRVRLRQAGADLSALQATLARAAPGTLVESHGAWMGRLTALGRSLQACAWLALAIVAGIAGSMVMLGVRASLLARREAIEIIHGLGATDAYIARRFAARAMALAGLGGLLGAVLAVPVLLYLGGLSAPFAAGMDADPPPPAWSAALLTALLPPDWATELAPLLAALGGLPMTLVIGLPALPVIAALIGYLTTQATVRDWLRGLP